MLNGNVNSSFFKQGNEFFVFLSLGFCARQVCAVSRCKVREKSLCFNRRKLGYFPAYICALFVNLKAYSAHTRINAKMKGNSFALLNCFVGKCLCRIVRKNRYAYIVFYNQIIRLGKNISQNQNGIFYSCFFKLNCFLNAGNAEEIAPAV